MKQQIVSHIQSDRSTCIWENLRRVRTLSMLLKESWSFIEDEDALAGNFYARLFLSDPGLRDLFPVTMDLQRSRLISAIVHAMQMIDAPDTFGEYLAALGRDHRKFHVRPDHYDLVGRCLIDALRDCCGPYWEPEYEQAWQQAYAVSSQIMIEGARRDQKNPPYWYAEVVKHERRTRDIAVITVRPLQPLPYQAGQYVSVECHYHPRMWRSYSIANAPRQDGLLEFHVHAVGAGWVSSALVWKVKQGDMLRLGSPIGSMTLDRSSRRDIVCLAGGTGLAPLKALIQELAKFNRTRWVHLFVGARTPDRLYDIDALMRLANRHPWLSIVPALSEGALAPGCERGTAAEVAARNGPWHDHDFFVCGSPEMVRGSLRTLHEMRIPTQRVRYDSFADVDLR